MSIGIGSVGDVVLATVRPYGADVLYTLNGAHVWPYYEAAARTGVPIVDVRHEQSAVFAAEAHAKLTRRLGLAVLTAGPGVTNGMSAIASAHFNGSPVFVAGGRAGDNTWGMGALQELDHVPLVSSLTRCATTIHDPTTSGTLARQAALAALTPKRGPVFVDAGFDIVFAPGGEVAAPLPWPAAPPPDDAAIDALAARLASAQRPAFFLGTDVYWAAAWAEAVAAAEAWQVPCFVNGMGRGCIAADHPLAFSRARPALRKRADLVVVIGTPLDFRLGYGNFGDAQVVRVAETADGFAPAGTADVIGDLRLTLSALANRVDDRPDRRDWVSELRTDESAVRERERALLEADSSPIKPTRTYGELLRRLDRDAVVIGDGGDFVSYAGKHVDSYTPGCWLDTGPYGCLGNGLGYAIAARTARPDKQVVVLLGDGAAGLSLLDTDTLVRHRLPVVMIVGNNGIWGLERAPMRAIYGYDIACELAAEIRYDEVVRALGGAGEIVREPAEIGPALDRALAAGVPYLVNVITDPDDIYPRS